MLHRPGMKISSGAVTVVCLIAMVTDEVGQVCMGPLVVSVFSMTTIARQVIFIATHKMCLICVLSIVKFVTSWQQIMVEF